MALPESNKTFSELNPVNSPGSSAQTDASTNYSMGNLINQNNVAEGPTIPPIQQGEFRIPRPNAFGVTSITSAKPMGSLIVFSWEDIDSFGSEIGEYRILANFAYDNNATPTEVGSSQSSPCTVQVVAPTATDAVFFLRPYLTNGQTLPLEQCPSCAVSIPGPVFQLQEGDDIIYIDGNRPTGGGPGSSTTLTFNTGGFWLVPANVTTATIEAWGAGGNGGTNAPAPIGSNGGGGGGGGGYGTGIVSVVPGNTYNIFVAAGGTSLSSYCDVDLAIYGNSGASGNSAGTGGAGGTGSTSTGTAGSNNSTTDGGNGGAASGGGGAGGTGGVAAPGGDGSAPGGGGGGGGVGNSGGAGSQGRVKISFSTSAGGGSAAGIGIVNSNGQLSSLTDGSLIFVNTAGKLTTAIGNSAGSGFVTIANGTAADDLTFLPGSAATAGAGAGKYLLVNLGGSPYKIALLSP